MAKKSLIDQANEIVPELRDPENIAPPAIIKDPFFSLKDSLFSFFENMLSRVQQEDTFMVEVKNAILEKIQTGEISISQLMILLNSLNNDKQSLIDSMLSIFKPAPGTGEISPLINPKLSDVADGSTPFSELSAEERNVLDKLQRISSEVEKENSGERSVN